MHLHLPKPLHGWRELAGEVGIIVVHTQWVQGAVSITRLAPVQRSLVLLATGSAWLGVRDSALLPLMPKKLVDNYWKIDATSQQLVPMLQHAPLSFDDPKRQ